MGPQARQLKQRRRDSVVCMPGLSGMSAVQLWAVLVVECPGGRGSGSGSGEWEWDWEWRKWLQATGQAVRLGTVRCGQPPKPDYEG